MGKDRSDEVRAVDRGVKLLDNQNPYWALGLNGIEDRLDIDDKRYCVLGEVYGHFDRGFAKLTGHPFDENNQNDIDWACDHGFWLKERDDDFDPLHISTRYERKARLEKSWARRTKARAVRIDEGSRFGSGKLA